jgi:hypothetical protein
LFNPSMATGEHLILLSFAKDDAHILLVATAHDS